MAAAAATATHIQGSGASFRTQAREAGIKQVPRFTRLGADHVEAIERCLRAYPALQGRMEIHLPGGRASALFTKEKLLVWPKFDRRPVCFLLFLEGFPPALWDPSRQEGFTLRWLLPPGFCVRGPSVCLANLLTGESVLQVEDLVVSEGADLWSTTPFSSRWEKLRTFWARLPADQPLLAVTPRIVEPIALADWAAHYDATLSWIVQPEGPKAQRFFWWDVVTPKSGPTYRAPALKRAPEVLVQVCALLKPAPRIGLPDTYMLYNGEGGQIGLAGISSIKLSQDLRTAFVAEATRLAGVKVEVAWSTEFEKYQITKILPVETPVSAGSFFLSGPVR
jgi:hypothetical protein